ncbi:IS110 family transposase (plasmid) [Acuticoccus sp. MNP-M23]|uniref:IS110 family transposase n=1 Tax=Acuticoccus sp. MNP-M23 TaxID=3072793 RepID=UPI0028163784|nr:IS110 family transposase [Acuticoccus sp. MNP-M23]WMS45326.1 IS110 family transposase [Acuticoccus sp. MNP-M23]
MFQAVNLDPNKCYVGLDVSLAETHICTIDGSGEVVAETCLPSDPDQIAAYLADVAPHAERIGLETGATTPWLWHELKQRGLPIVCLCARHAHRVLSMRHHKTDRNDARGLAELMRVGWYREVAVRSVNAQLIRSMIAARYRLRSVRRDLLNQMRGVVKAVGLITDSTAGRTFPERVRAAIEVHPFAADVLVPLLAAHDAVVSQVAVYDRRLASMAKDDADAKRLMTIPGVGPIVALAYMATIDDPHRFKTSSAVGPYLGLAPRRYQSGEIDHGGHIGHAPCPIMRSYLYEAATVLLHRTSRWCRLRSWGMRLVKRIGFKRAAIAVARKIGVIMHAIWVDGTEYEPKGA